MSDYQKTVDFAVKDTLVSGDPLKIVKGTEIDTEYLNIQTAVATKVEAHSGHHTGNTVIDNLEVTGQIIQGGGGGIGEIIDGGTY
jgi:hypothetical protein